MPPSATQLSAPPSPPSSPPTRSHGGRVALCMLVVAAVVGAYYAGRGTLPFGGATKASQQASKYHCPMHPTVVSDTKGSCPICGMDLVLISDAETPAAPTAQPDQPLQYHCPMHPTVVSDKKGSCPICGMDLVPIEKGTGDQGGQSSSVPGLAAVSITAETRQRMGLTLGTVEPRALTREVRTSARLSADETRLFNVTTKVEGWVDVLFVNVTGQTVSKGDPLLTIYSPDLVSAQQEYLTALQATEASAATTATSPTRRSGEALLAAARRRLQLWDISEAQLQRLEKSRAVEKTMTLSAGAAGVVLEKSVIAGQKIMPGDPLLVIADLTTVWADADLYPSDLPYVQVGMPVEVTLPYWPNQTFAGKVTFIAPILDPGTRTVKARLVIPNPELLLKPNLYADARLSYPLGEVLAIPEAAVMRTGEHTYAFKDGGDGRLIPTEIRVGPRSGAYIQVLEGLAAGDAVVTSANFLVDSESSLKAALAAMGGGAQ